MERFKLFADFEKEEQYLHDMAEKGYLLNYYHFGGLYGFKKGPKQELNYCVDYRTFKHKKDYEDYKNLFEDFGWKHIAGTLYSGTQYFLPVNEEGNKEIFSSRESSAARYKRFFKMNVICFVSAVIYFVASLISMKFSIGNLGFLTPGIWELTGNELTRAVLFELPWVIFRVFPFVLLVALGAAYGVLAVKAQGRYKYLMEEGKSI
jgi:hypothetical protein